MSVQDSQYDPLHSCSRQFSRGKETCLLSIRNDVRSSLAPAEYFPHGVKCAGNVNPKASIIALQMGGA